VAQWLELKILVSLVRTSVRVITWITEVETIKRQTGTVRVVV